MRRREATLKKIAVSSALTLGVSTLLFSSCTSLTCRTDACYDRQLAGLDPFEAGDIAAWGTEKEQAEKERRQEKRAQHKEYLDRK